MDFITGLPRVQGLDCIYVVMDQLMKYVHVFMISSSYTVAQVAKVFFIEVLCLHGFPKNILGDRDSMFIGDFLKELFRLVDTKLKPCTNYYS